MAIISLETTNKEDIRKYSDLLSLSKIFFETYESEKCKLPYHLNIIDELHINENAHSRILMRLFCYRNERGEYEILESFVDYIRTNTHYEDFSRIKIKKPTITQEEQRIDLWVRDRSYAMIFENKVYNAIDQDAQLHRYIEKTIKENYKTNNIFVIYLPQKYHEPDDNSWGIYKKEFESRFVIIPFQDDILKWLKQGVLPNIRHKDQYLYSAVVQYIDYLEGLFEIRTINKKMIMNLEELIVEHLDLSNCSSDKDRIDVLKKKISDFNRITNALVDKYRQNIFDSWKSDIRSHFTTLSECPFPDKYIGVDIDYYGKLIHVFIYANSRFYCQVEYDRSLPEDERKIKGSPVMQLDNLLKYKNDTQIWEYFNYDDFEGVYDCFKKVIDRCLNSK